MVIGALTPGRPNFTSTWVPALPISRPDTSSRRSPEVGLPSTSMIRSPVCTPPSAAGEPGKVAVTTTVPSWSWMFIPTPA